MREPGLLKSSPSRASKHIPIENVDNGYRREYLDGTDRARCGQRAAMQMATITCPGTDRERTASGHQEVLDEDSQAGGIERFRLHDLRHNHASVLASRGASLHEIGRQLGHTQMQTTMRYADLIRERQREVAALFTLPLPAIAGAGK